MNYLGPNHGQLGEQQTVVFYPMEPSLTQRVNVYPGFLLE